jgi:hypothetical protein
LSTPDIAYDGIVNPSRSNPELCIRQGDDIVVMNLDAGNDFKNLIKGPKLFDCEGVKVNPIK